MHYRHSFHAGNFADVFKHTVLCALFRGLNCKPAPWSFVDTHAGAGLYDLGSEGAIKTGEAQDGIGRIWDAQPEFGPLTDYLAIVREVQKVSGRKLYPGSPLIARHYARTGDRLVLFENADRIASELERLLAGERRARVYNRDGYEAHGMLPPKEKRGLVLCDPPFEARDEFERVAEFLQRSVARFSNGIFAVWYPMKNAHESRRFERSVARDLKREAVVLRLSTGAAREGQMRDCAMLVVNPPFGLPQDMKPALAWLGRELAQGRAAQHEFQPLR